MDRVFESGAIGTPPTAPASPSVGYPTKGNPAIPTEATKPGPWWYHMVTEEIRNVISSAGLTPNHEDLTQLAQAIQSLATAVEIRRISAAVGSNALTISATALSLDFRSTTLGSGAITKVSGAPANLVISSGSTLGSVSGKQCYIAVLALNVAGTIELAAVNLAGGVNLDETGLISTTAEGGAGAADSATVVYSATARSNVAYRVIGVIQSTQAAAGTWATAPSLVQGSGGQALSSMQTLGYGQTWQNVTGSRAISTTYYNTTGKPIMVWIMSQYSTGYGPAMTINGVAFNQAGAAGASVAKVPCVYIVPPGASYSITGAFETNGWLELR